MSNPGLVRRLALDSNAAGEVSPADILSIAPNSQNFIMNSNFDFWQRSLNATGLTGPGYAAADRWSLRGSGGLGAMQFARSDSFPSNGKSLYSAVLACTSTATPSNQMRALGQAIEGNILRMFAGQRMTLSFWVMSNQTGTWGISFKNASSTRAYHTTYTINNPNTWEYKEVAFTHDMTGTWNYDNNSGLEIAWMLAASVEFQTSTFDTWTNDNNFRAPAAQPNFFSSTLNQFRITQVMLNIGENAASHIPFGGTFDRDYMACLRYYNGNGVVSSEASFASGTRGGLDAYVFPVIMRANPTVIAYGNGVAHSVRNNNTGATEATGTILYGASTIAVGIRSTGSLSDDVQYGASLTIDAEL